MAKKKSKELQQKEASVTVLQRIAKALLNSKNKQALELGGKLQGLKEGIEELPKEVFDALGAKFEKNYRELTPNTNSDVLDRLEKIAAQLEQTTVTPQGLSGSHNTGQIQNVAAELAQLKQQTESLQQVQQDMKATVQDVKEASNFVQQTLQATTAQVEQVKATTNEAVTASNKVLTTVESQTSELLNKLNETASLTTHIEKAVKEQIEASFVLTVSEQQKRDTFLESLEQKVEQGLESLTKVSKQRFTQLDDSVASFEDELEDMKKALKTPVEAIVGQVNSVKEELAQLKNVTAFLEEKAKESLQLVEADENEAYVTEAAELVRVLVDRLYVGAQLYAKHRETIEAMERGEQEEAAWQIEKQRYESSMVEIEKLQMKVTEKEAEIAKLEAELTGEKTRAKVKEEAFKIDALRFMATALPIEHWPDELVDKVKEAKIQAHENFKQGEQIDVTVSNMSKVSRYVDLPNEAYGKIMLLTSAYYNKDSGWVVQKAKSEIVVEQTT